MVIPTLVILGLCAVLSARLSGSFLFPAALFSGYWAFIIAFLVLSGDAFYPVSGGTWLVIVVGVVSFCFSGWLVHAGLRCSRLGASGEWPLDIRRVRGWLGLVFVFLIAVFPLYWRHISELALASGVENFWIGLRYETSVVNGGSAFGIYGYLAPLASFVAIASWYCRSESRLGRLRDIGVIALALVYNLSSLGRTGTLLLIVGLVVISWLRSGHLQIRSTVVGAAAAVAAFGGVAILLGKGVSVDGGVGSTLIGLYDTARVYLVGGIVAFDQHLQGFAPQLPGNYTLHFFIALGNALGLHLAGSPLVLQYALTPQPTNVYTMFYAYYADFGLLGVGVFTAVFGAISTSLYVWAQRGHPVATILCSLMVAEIVLSVGNEPFFTQLSYWLQFAGYAGATFWLIGRSNAERVFVLATSDYVQLSPEVEI